MTLFKYVQLTGGGIQGPLDFFARRGVWGGMEEPALKGRLLTSQCKPGALLLDTKVAKATLHKVATNDLLATMPGGTYGSYVADFFDLPNRLPLTPLGTLATPYYTLIYKESAFEITGEHRILTRDMILRAIEKVAINANMGSGDNGGTGEVRYSERFDYGAPGRGFGLGGIVPYIGGHHINFPIGTFRFRTRFYYNNPSVLLEFESGGPDGSIILFPGVKVGSKLSVRFLGVPWTKAIASYKRGGTSGIGQTNVGVAASRLSFSATVIPIAGTFTNESPTPVLLDRDYLYDMFGGGHYMSNTVPIVDYGAGCPALAAGVEEGNSGYRIDASVNIVVPPSRAVWVRIWQSFQFDGSWVGELTHNVQDSFNVIEDYDTFVHRGTNWPTATIDQNIERRMEVYVQFGKVSPGD